MGPRGEALLLLLLLAAGALPGGCSGSSSSHSLRYFYTGVSEPGQGLPQFIIVGYVDEQLFVQYDSNTQRARPRTPWMETVGEEDPSYWDRNSQIAQNDEQVFRVDLRNVPKYYNQSGGFHTLQYMYGCELRGDGSVRGYDQYAYDGRDYISFNMETLTWTAADSAAQVTKRKLENVQEAQHFKSYLEKDCTDWLQKYLDYGKGTLLKTERPVVKVTSQAEHDGTETLVCQAHGFYPKAIETTWRRDGEVMDHATFRRDVAPNSDGTYHAWLSIKVDPTDRDRYRCRVEHDSLLEPLDFAWEEPGASNLGLIVGCVVGATVALLVAGIVGIYFYKKRQDGYKAASTKDQNSDSSGSNPAI
ncbi:H-2 class I histocompatibility antigen, Q9 alpha chain-like isoform X2 [Elgaria multicarinata webbii]|uniref:H-2 class I histocompatibility antigen, Q9 alpha chain-like isoform X2 n=1 Tax=Elgaria multicarinata webbii TaxID=159646 RepID=UPI002FCD1AE7